MTLLALLSGKDKTLTIRETLNKLNFIQRKRGPLGQSAADLV